jgi:hypothetical protein
MTFRSKGLERGDVDHMRQRREWLAALLVIKPAQSAVPMWIVVEVDADTALSLRDRFVAARAERTMRATAARRHGIESQEFPQVRSRPAI